MRHTLLKCSALTYYAIFAAVIALTGVYARSAVNMFSAFAAYQQFQRTSKLTDDHASAPELRQLLATAMSKHPEHGDYHAAFGSLLSEYPGSDAAQAETHLREAILRDPANADYYYEAGRISADRQTCSPSPSRSPDDAAEACAAARYFLSAWRNAPNDLFFRSQIAPWLNYYHHDLTVRLMRQFLADDATQFLGRPRDYVEAFGQTLYQLQMDVESERTLELAGMQPSTCQAMPLPSDASVLEIANDDGAADWMTTLRAQDDRVKKVFCLPERIEEFQAVSLRILMNRSSDAGEGCALIVGIDEITRLIPCDTIGVMPEWHEIPLDPDELTGKFRLTVFLRVSGMAQGWNALEIWGDQQAATQSSVFGFRQTADLSQSEGKQLGEYMIRLRLMRSQPNHLP